MIASKVSFSQHTKELLNARPLSRTAKAKLRRQRVVEYIRELPFGECQKSDLITAAGWDISVQPQYANGWAFIERLKKHKVIRMSEGTNPRNSHVKKWEVVGDVKVTKPAVEPRKTFEEIVNKPIFSAAPVEQRIDFKLKTDATSPDIKIEEMTVTDDLLEQAKNFAWNTNSDSLREFLAWLKR